MSIFKITDMQRHQIVSSIQYYIDNLDNPTLKKSYLEKIKDEDFENKMIYSFAEMNFLSQSLIVSIKKMFDFNVIAQKILDNSVNDEYEIKELKLFVINRLLDERLIYNLSLSSDNKRLNEGQIKEYRFKMSEFKKNYMNLFEKHSKANL